MVFLVCERLLLRNSTACGYSAASDAVAEEEGTMTNLEGVCYYGKRAYSAPGRVRDEIDTCVSWHAAWVREPFSL